MVSIGKNLFLGKRKIIGRKYEDKGIFGRMEKWNKGFFMVAILMIILMVSFGILVLLRGLERFWGSLRV